MEKGYTSNPFNAHEQNYHSISDTDDSEDEGVETEPIGGTSKNGSLNNNQDQNVQITTEGTTQYDLSQFYSNIKALDLKQCTFCNKFFKKDMVVPVFDNKGSDNNAYDETQCWHCLFWMNYPIPSRKHVDGTYGMTIVDYIIKCKDVHELATCSRNSDSGGCFLCEYNLGFPLTDVKDLYKLTGSSELPDDPIDDLDGNEGIDDSYQPGQITVEI